MDALPSNGAPGEDENGWNLLMPFIVCQSKGGPYDDDAFTAGWHCGSIDAELTALYMYPNPKPSYTVRAEMVPQLELIGMRHGFPVLVAEATGYPEWTLITFFRGSP